MVMRSSSIVRINPNRSVFVNGIIEAAALNYENFLWTLTIQQGPDDQDFLHLECAQLFPQELWEIEIEVKVGFIHGLNGMFANIPGIRNFKFTNYNRSASIFGVQKFNFPYGGLGYCIGVETCRVYDFSEGGLFDREVENMSDVKLIVEGQELYACKKILAQQSSSFYNLFYVENAQDVKIFVIKNATCNSFRLFLAMMYHQKVEIKNDDIKALIELSSRFKATQCLEECEKFLIQADIEIGLKFKLSKGVGFWKLYPAALQSYCNVQDVLDLEKNEHYEHFDKDVKLAIFRKMVQLKITPENYLNFEQNGTITKTVDGLQWDIKMEYEDKKWTISIECNKYDDNSPWSSTLKLRAQNISNQAFREETLHFNRENWRQVKVFDSVNRKLGIRFGKVFGYFEQKSTNFCDFRPNLTDIVLSVGDKKFHVSKQILANASTNFYTMFYEEQNHLSEIPLENIDKNEFEELLQHIYHPSRHITDNNIEGLIRLSQMFNVRSILERCIAMIQTPDRLNIMNAYQVSQKFNLPGLLNNPMSQIQTPEDFRRFAQQDGFPELPADLIRMIAMQAFKN